MIVQSLQHCLNFQVVPRLFSKDGRFGVYFKISTGGNIRTAVITGHFTLAITLVNVFQNLFNWFHFLFLREVVYSLF